LGDKRDNVLVLAKSVRANTNLHTAFEICFLDKANRTQHRTRSRRV